MARASALPGCVSLLEALAKLPVNLAPLHCCFSETDIWSHDGGSHIESGGELRLTCLDMSWLRPDDARLLPGDRNRHKGLAHDRPRILSRDLQCHVRPEQLLPRFGNSLAVWGGKPQTHKDLQTCMQNAILLEVKEADAQRAEVFEAAQLWQDHILSIELPSCQITARKGKPLLGTSGNDRI